MNDSSNMRTMVNSKIFSQSFSTCYTNTMSLHNKRMKSVKPFVYVQPRGSYWNQDKSCFRKCMYIYLNYFFSNHIWVFINLNWLRKKFSRFADLSLLVRSDHAMQTFSLCAYLLKVFTEKVVE